MQPAQSSNGTALPRLILSAVLNGASPADFIEFSKGEYGATYISPIGGGALNLRWLGLDGGSGPNVLIAENSLTLSAGSASIAILDDGTIVFTSDVLAVNGLATRVVNSATDHAMTANDYTVAITDTSSVRTVTLPDSPTDGRIVCVKDRSGSASDNPIVINRNGSTIDGVLANDEISDDGGSKTYQFTSGDWMLIAKV